MVTEDIVRNHYSNLLGCYDLALDLIDKAFQDAVISKLIARLRTVQHSPEPLPSGPHQHLFISLFTAPFLGKLTKDYGPDSSLWNLSVAAAAQWASKEQIEALMRSGSDPKISSGWNRHDSSVSGSEQFKVDLGKHMVGLRKVVILGDFAPSPGSTSEKIYEETSL
jgi:hypothetical protein